MKSKEIEWSFWRIDKEEQRSFTISFFFLSHEWNSHTSQIRFSLSFIDLLWSFFFFSFFFYSWNAKIEPFTLKTLNLSVRDREWIHTKNRNCGEKENKNKRSKRRSVLATKNVKTFLFYFQVFRKKNKSWCWKVSIVFLLLLPQLGSSDHFFAIFSIFFTRKSKSSSLLEESWRRYPILYLHVSQKFSTEFRHD